MKVLTRTSKMSIIKQQTFDVVLLLATKRDLHHLHQIQHQIARIGQEKKGVSNTIEWQIIWGSTMNTTLVTQ